MSLTLSPITKKVVIEEVVNLDAPRSYLIEKGGNVSTFQPVSTTNFSTSQVTWTVNVPSLHTCVDRLIYQQIPLQLAFTGPAPSGGANLLQLNQGIWSIRSYPVSQITTSIAVQINNSSVTSQPYTYVSALQHARIYQMETNLDMSCWPTLPDNCQSYHDLLGASNNPLNGYSSSNYWQQGRGSFPITVVSNTPTSAVIQVLLNEPMFLSPFLYSPKHEQNGLFYLNQFNIQIQFGNLLRALSYNAVDGNTITSIVPSIYSNPQLLIRYVTPDIVMSIPKELYYNYESINVFQTNNFIVTSGSVANLVSNNIQLQQIPGKIYIYARRQDADLQAANGYTFADGFASIQNVSVNFNNVSGILASASQTDLWRMSKRNGVNLSWGDWVGNGPISVADSISSIGVGSIVCMKVSQDFGLPSDLAPGVYGEQFNLQINMQIKNISSATVTYTFYIVCIQDGILTMTESTNTLLQLGTLTKPDILGSATMERIPYHEAMSPWGGDFFGDLGSLSKKVLNAAKDYGLPALKATGRIAANVAPYALPLLLAAGEDESGGKMASRRKMKSKLPKSKPKKIMYRRY